MKKESLKFLLIAIYVAIMTFIAWYCNGRILIGIDDANIYMVYMRNLAEGHGLVYNIDGERVEGFTSLLWTLLGGLFFLISDRPEILLLCTNLVVVSYALWKLISYLDSYKNNFLITPAAIVLLGLLAMTPGYFDWTVLSLLETGLWSSLLILTSLNLIKAEPEQTNNNKNTIEFNILIVLLILCRPESMLWGVFFITMRAGRLLIKTREIRKSALLMLPSVLAFVFSLLGLIIWRKIYFGFPFPNTYYAKVSSERIQNIIAGTRYVINYLTDNPMVILILLLIPISLYEIFKQKKIDKNYPFLIVVGIILVTFAIPLYAGGDHFGYYRFIQPTVPLLILGFLLSLRILGLEINYQYSLILVIFSIYIPKNKTYKSILYQRSLIAKEWVIASEQRHKAEMLNTFFSELPKHPSQGVLAAGGSGFSYKGFTNDLLGLNNVEMAHSEKTKNSFKNHSSFNKDVFFKQRPDLFMIASEFINVNQNITPLEVTKFEGLIFQNIHLDDKFAEYYSRVLLTKKESEVGLIVFASRAFLETLDTDYYKYTPI